MAEEIIKQFFKEIFEKLLKILSKGVPELHIPSFDPLSVPGAQNITFHESFFVSTEASFSEITVTGLSTLSPPELHWDSKKKVLSATVITKALQGKGTYALKGRAGIIPLHGSGDFTYDIELVTAKIGVECNLNDIVKLDPKIMINLEFGNTKLHLDNLEGGGIAGEILNKIINLFRGKIADNVSKGIAETMQDALQKFIEKEREREGFDRIIDAIKQ